MSQGQLGRVSFLLPLWVPNIELKSTRFGSKSFYPMAHLSGPIFIVLMDVGVEPAVTGQCSLHGVGVGGGWDRRSPGSRPACTTETVPMSESKQNKKVLRGLGRKLLRAPQGSTPSTTNK